MGEAYSRHNYLRDKSTSRMTCHSK